MKKLILAIVAILFLKTFYSQTVFKVNSKELADISIFVTTDSTEADLNVMVVPQVEFAVSDGLWFYSNFAQEAVLKIFFVNNIQDADIKVFYVNTEEQTGWHKIQNRPLYRPKE